jgi:uncharacterized membrane protein YsdA (DUF1294 family)
MSIGIAAVIIFVLYLIDKHGQWRQTAKIAGALVVLALVGWGALLGYDKYDVWHRAKAEHAAAVTACLVRNGSGRGTQKACEIDPTVVVEGKVKVTANFVKCGVDADGHIFSDGKGGCIPPPPDGYVIDKEPQGDIFDQVAREDCQKRLMKQVTYKIPAGSVLEPVVKACAQDPGGKWVLDPKTNVWLNQSKSVPIPAGATIEH